MKITKLSLTNFRSFRCTQTIDFADLTLLFGPNSVGKSSVLLALFYLQEVIKKGHCNPQRIDALGNRFVGGFENLVHGRDLSRDIVLIVEYDKEGAIGSTYSELVSTLDESGIADPALLLLLEDVAAGTERVALEFVIAWSDTNNTAYVKEFAVWLNDGFVGKISCDAGLKNPQVSDLNLRHPLLLPVNHEEWLEEQYLEGSGFLHSSWSTHFDAIDGSSKPESPEDAFSDDGFVSKLDVVLGGLSQFAVGTRAGALPKTGSRLKTLFSETVLSDDSYLTTIILEEVLSEVFVSPLDDLLALLDDSVCIGPLRCIPDSTYQPNQHPAQGDWYDGTASWDILSKPSLLRDPAISNWLSDEDKLNLGYKLVYTVRDSETRFVTPTYRIESLEDALATHDAIGDQLQTTVSTEPAHLNPDVEQIDVPDQTLEDMHVAPDFGSSKIYVGKVNNKERRLSLWDCRNDIPVSSSDVGVGVSQVLPLVVASQSVQSGLIACEQPELHVHPRVQVAIGDLLTQPPEQREWTAWPQGQFLIETHSEHLILRVLRRVRETNDGELPKGLSPVEKNSVSIVYLEPTDGGVVAKTIDITEEGDFMQRWPDGFFAERAEELF